MTVRECFRKTEEMLRDGAGDALHEAGYIMTELSEKDRSWLFAHGTDPVDDEMAEKAFDAARRRLLGEPLQYIFRRADFFGYSIYVDERVLIPRQDTEIMAKEAEAFAEERKARGLNTRALDLCTGSGALALALTRSCSSVTASDISPDALAVADINLKNNGACCELVQSDLFDALEGRVFDLIVSNPPYIPAGEIEGLGPEVKDHEPRLALDGGADGMDLVRRIISVLGDHLAPEGLAILEIGNGQAEEVCRMAEAEGFSARTMSDFSGEQRFVKIYRD
jgi:release factor glutamine methyltransferase